MKNQGDAPTSVPVWQDCVILSQNPNLTYSSSADDQLLNNQPVIVAFNNPSYLDVGQSYSQTVNVTLPISAQGTWYAYIIPDGTGRHHPFAMPEASRSNKLQISTGFNVAISPPPALVVTSVAAPMQSFSGMPIDVTWTVTNTGAGPTTLNYFLGSPHSPDSVWGDAVFISTHDPGDANLKGDHVGFRVALRTK